MSRADFSGGQVANFALVSKRKRRVGHWTRLLLLWASVGQLKLGGGHAGDVPAFERIALPAWRDALDHRKIVIIDEIGKMELASPRFCDLAREALDSSLMVLATVMEKPHPFADEIKRRRDAEIMEVTRGNRDELPAKIALMVMEML